MDKFSKNFKRIEEYTENDDLVGDGDAGDDGEEKEGDGPEDMADEQMGGGFEG